jgi:hypothetical protein
LTAEQHGEEVAEILAAAIIRMRVRTAPLVGRPGADEPANSTPDWLDASRSLRTVNREVPAKWPG